MPSTKRLLLKYEKHKYVNKELITAQNMPRITTKIGKGYRVTLPEPAREALGVRVGDYLTWIVEEGTVEVVRATVIKCPHCGFEAPLEDFGLVRKPWRFRFYTVRRLQCPNCGKVFNYYSGKAPSGKVVEYVTRGRA